MATFVGHSGGSLDQITAKAVAEAAAQGDSVAKYIMGEAARWLARAILTIIRIVNPEKVILGGGVAQAGPVLLEPLRDALKGWQSSSVCYTTEIVPAALGTRASLYGAAVLALDLSSEGKSITT
jgi:glucokinase